MTERSDRLLQEIEAGALDSKTPIVDLLRKAASLGAQTGSAELRDWAVRELHGYGLSDEVPTYRQIITPLTMTTTGREGFESGPVGTSLLPDYARDLSTQMPVRMGIAQIESEASSGYNASLKPPNAPDIIAHMNSSRRRTKVKEIYWVVPPKALRGVVDHVRTALNVLVAEIHANVPARTITPPAEVASNAITFAVTGQRNTISFAAPQGASTIMTTTTPEKSRRWLKIVGGILGGVIAIAGLIFALMEVQGWSF